MARKETPDLLTAEEFEGAMVRAFELYECREGHEFDAYLKDSGGVKELAKALINRGIRAILVNPEKGYYPAKALEAMQKVLKEYVLLLDRENDLGMEKTKERLGEIEKKVLGLKEENERLRAERATLEAGIAVISVGGVGDGRELIKPED